MTLQTIAADVLQTALLTLGFPVSRLFHNTKNNTAPDTYITFHQLSGEGVDHADDDPQGFETRWRVNLFSRKNYSNTVQGIYNALHAVEFYGIEIMAEQFEQDTGYFHAAIEANFFENQGG
jgi:hypothetical protein